MQTLQLRLELATYATQRKALLADSTRYATLAELTQALKELSR